MKLRIAWLGPLRLTAAAEGMTKPGAVAFGDGTPPIPLAPDSRAEHTYTTPGPCTVVLLDAAGAVVDRVPLFVRSGADPEVAFEPRADDPHVVDATWDENEAYLVSEYHLDWGDGTPIEKVVAPPGFCLSHTYQRGVYYPRVFDRQARRWGRYIVEAGVLPSFTVAADGVYTASVQVTLSNVDEPGTCRIDWGDGSPPELYNPSVHEDWHNWHTYDVDAPETFWVRVLDAAGHDVAMPAEIVVRPPTDPSIPRFDVVGGEDRTREIAFQRVPNGGVRWTWGDGSEEEIIGEDVERADHTYAQYGEYVLMMRERLRYGIVIQQQPIEVLRPVTATVEMDGTKNLKVTVHDPPRDGCRIAWDDPYATTLVTSRGTFRHRIYLNKNFNIRILHTTNGNVLYRIPTLRVDSPDLPQMSVELVHNKPRTVRLTLSKNENPYNTHVRWGDGKTLVIPGKTNDSWEYAYTKSGAYTIGAYEANSDSWQAAWPVSITITDPVMIATRDLNFADTVRLSIQTRQWSYPMWIDWGAGSPRRLYNPAKAPMGKTYDIPDGQQSATFTIRLFDAETGGVEVAKAVQFTAQRRETVV